MHVLVTNVRIIFIWKRQEKRLLGKPGRMREEIIKINYSHSRPVRTGYNWLMIVASGELMY
jgi:hypothetical protein